MQWLPDPKQINGDNLSSEMRDAGRHFRKKEKEYLVQKMNELPTDSKNNKIRDLNKRIHEFKMGKRPRTGKGREW